MEIKSVKSNPKTTIKAGEILESDRNAVYLKIMKEIKKSGKKIEREREERERGEGGKRGKEIIRN